MQVLIVATGTSFLHLDIQWCNAVHSAQSILHLGASLDTVVCLSDIFVISTEAILLQHKADFLRTIYICQLTLEGGHWGSPALIVLSESDLM